MQSSMVTILCILLRYFQDTVSNSIECCTLCRLHIPLSFITFRISDREHPDSGFLIDFIILHCSPTFIVFLTRILVTPSHWSLRSLNSSNSIILIISFYLVVYN